MSRANNLFAVVILVALSTCAYPGDEPGIKLPQRPGIKFLAGATSASWAPDGKTLHYCSEGKLWRFDVASERSHSLGKTWAYAVSPDGQYALLSGHTKTGKIKLDRPFGTLVLKIRTLRTGKESEIFKVNNSSVYNAGWLSNKLIACTFGQYDEKYKRLNSMKQNTIVTDTRGKVLVAIPETLLKIAGADHKGFVYHNFNNTNGAYYYEIATKKSTRLPDVAHVRNYMYLSSKQLVYKDLEGDVDRVNLVDMKTMKIHDLKWETSSGTRISISPTMSNYWEADLPHNENSKPKLYLGDTPAYALKTMRQIEAGKL